MRHAKIRKYAFPSQSKYSSDTVHITVSDEYFDLKTVFRLLRMFVCLLNRKNDLLKKKYFVINL